MLNFDKAVWTIHRKLHHRFLKYRKLFVQATEDLAEYQKAFVEGETVTRNPNDHASPKSSQIVCLLLSDSEGSVIGSDDSYESPPTTPMPTSATPPSSIAHDRIYTTIRVMCTIVT